jgi:RNA polymerase sigma-70 factor (ECF subfamily)
LDNNLNNSIILNNKQEFKKLFDLYYPALYLFASTIVNDNFLAEDLVQEVFIKLWEKSDGFDNIHAIKSFLYTSVKNKCLNHIEHEKVIQKHKEYTQHELLNYAVINNQIIEEETHRLIYNAINELASECKNILLLSINGLKNKEIAEELHISVNTVKTQKKIAYKQLKIKLKGIYLIAGLLFGSIL